MHDKNKSPKKPWTPKSSTRSNDSETKPSKPKEFTKSSSKPWEVKKSPHSREPRGNSTKPWETKRAPKKESSDKVNDDDDFIAPEMISTAPYDKKANRASKPWEEKKPSKASETSYNSKKPWEKESKPANSRDYKKTWDKESKDSNTREYKKPSKPWETKNSSPAKEAGEESSTSWEPVKKWYHSAVGEDGHYFHKQIIIPGVLRLLNIESSTTPPAILDLACGQGILGRHIPQNVRYLGFDISPSLVKEAKKADTVNVHDYSVADVTKPLPKQKALFTHATVILALQNIERPDLVFNNVFQNLQSGGKLLLVLNHPCFRIPRQSSWQVDAEKKVQFRRIDRYYSPMQIPIQAHPSKGEKSPNTMTFHHPISDYSKWLHDSGFCITLIEEWCSDKVSTGGAAKMENRSREEIPMFMTILATKR